MKDKQAENALKALIEKANAITLIQQYARDDRPTRKVWLKAFLEVDGIEVEVNLTPIFLKADGGSKKDYITVWGGGVQAIDIIGDTIYESDYIETEKGEIEFFRKTTTKTLKACY